MKPMGLRSVAPHSQQHQSVQTLCALHPLLQDGLTQISIFGFQTLAAAHPASHAGSFLKPGPHTEPITSQPRAGAAQGRVEGLQLHSPGSHFGDAAVPCCSMPSAGRGAQRRGPPGVFPSLCQRRRPAASQACREPPAPDCKTAGRCAGATFPAAPGRGWRPRWSPLAPCRAPADVLNATWGPHHVRRGGEGCGHGAVV